jgi:hypothetical protein
LLIGKNIFKKGRFFGTPSSTVTSKQNIAFTKDLLMFEAYNEMEVVMEFISSNTS